jgi:hypothetical protein
MDIVRVKRQEWYSDTVLETVTFQDWESVVGWFAKRGIGETGLAPGGLVHRSEQITTPYGPHWIKVIYKIDALI